MNQKVVQQRNQKVVESSTTFFLKRRKKILRTLIAIFMFSENTCACVLALERAVFGLGYFFVSLALNLVPSTPPLSLVRLSQIVSVFYLSPTSTFM